MLSPTLPKPVSPTPATAPVSTSSPITLCLRALNLHTTTHQPANKEAEKVEAAIRAALSDQRTEPEAIAIILNNAFNHGYVPVLNNMILQIKKADKDQTIPITDKVIEILHENGIALTVQEDGQVEMRKRTSTFSSDPLRDDLVTSALDVFPKDIIGLIQEEDNRQVLPMDSNGRIQFNDKTKDILMKALALDCTNSEENRNIKRQIIEQAIQQNKQSYLNKMLAALYSPPALFSTRYNHPVDLYKVNLSGLDLRDIDFSYVELSYANLSHANLSDVDWIGVNLVGANLYKAKMNEAMVVISNLDGAIMDEVSAQNASFCGSSMKGVFMHKANISGASMSAYKFEHVSFSKMKRTNLTGANMTGAIATNAKFDGAILDQAILENTNLTGANLDASFSAPRYIYQ